MSRSQEKKGRILIADDNADFTLGLKMLISPYFEEVVVESNPDKILNHIETQHFDLVLLDMNFRAGMHSGNEGFFIMNKIREKNKETRLVFITGYGDVELAVESMKKGASDFIEKSWEERKILSTILANYRLSRSMDENRLRKNQGRMLTEAYGQDHAVCVGISAKMAKVMEVIRKVSPTDADILITGESGTGKEVMARQIHLLSNRADDIFLPVDLGAIPSTLFESELFGYRRGAFTDAVNDKPGKIESASGGTLFLDEIGNLPPELQTKMLGIIQQRLVTRLGETRSHPVDFRLITATNAFIPDLIRQKLFREDLYYRIRTVEIELPPLRERAEDIPELVECFINTFSGKYKKEGMSIDKKAIKKLQDYHWPGNVRELQHQIEKAVIMSDGAKILAADLDLGSGTESRMRTETLNLEQHEKMLIVRAIKKSEGNLSRAASALGINRSTLYEKIKKYEIRPL
jgi:DNA-binding NtrC family response regulator